MQGVPQGSVLSRLLFNVVMAVLPIALPKEKHIPVNVAIYADDIVLWCVGQSSRATTIRASLQDALSTVSSCLAGLGLTASPTETASLLLPLERSTSFNTFFTILRWEEGAVCSTTALLGAPPS